MLTLFRCFIEALKITNLIATVTRNDGLPALPILKINIEQCDRINLFNSAD